MFVFFSALRNAKQEELNEQENNGNLNLLEIAKRQTAKQNELTQCEGKLKARLVLYCRVVD